MNPFLKVIKDRGKAIIVQGPEGSAKTLLANCLAAGVQTAHTAVENLLGDTFTEWLGLHPAVVIVQGFADTPKGVAQLAALVSMPRLSCRVRGLTPMWVDAPLFIFETHKPVKLPRALRRFYIITLEPGGAW